MYEMYFKFKIDVFKFKMVDFDCDRCYYSSLV